MKTTFLRPLTAAHRTPGLVLLFAALACSLLLTRPAAARQESLATAVARLDQAQTADDYQALEKVFLQTPAEGKEAWLPDYYAALCNAQTGFLYLDDGEKIEPFARKGEAQIKQAIARLDTATQQAALAEAYVVLSMVYRTYVYINTVTYGKKYGIRSSGALRRAAALAPDNARVLYLQAWEKYYTPKMWGGDKKLARQLAEKALQRLSADEGGVTPHWGRRECEALLAKYK